MQRLLLIGAIGATLLAAACGGDSKKTATPAAKGTASPSAATKPATTPATTQAP